MSCEDFRKLIEDWEAEKMRPAPRKKTLEHLNTCEECQEWLEGKELCLSEKMPSR